MITDEVVSWCGILAFIYHYCNLDSYEQEEKDDTSAIHHNSYSLNNRIQFETCYMWYLSDITKMKKIHTTYEPFGGTFL